MTEQARLSGDASNDAGLDDSIAFSRYTEAIVGEASPLVNRISHQYLLWEEAQDEFRKYQKMYRTAGGVARSFFWVAIRFDLMRLWMVGRSIRS